MYKSSNKQILEVGWYIGFVEALERYAFSKHWTIIVKSEQLIYVDIWEMWIGSEHNINYFDSIRNNWNYSMWA